MMDGPMAVKQEDFQAKARRLVVEYFNGQVDKSDGEVGIVLADTYVVWFSKTLQNWKALVSTVVPDSTYYEVTYDGDKAQTYLDVYKKWRNVCVVD